MVGEVFRVVTWKSPRLKGKEGQTDREHPIVQWYEILLSPISLRSFSSVWFWIALAGFWTVQNRHVMGVPFDRVLAAREGDDDAGAEALTLARLHVRRRLRRADGVMRVAVAAFAASTAVALAVSGLELAQAVALMLLPWLWIETLRQRLAHRLAEDAPDAAALVRHLILHRLTVQAITGAAIFVTVLWGAWRNLSLSILH